MFFSKTIIRRGLKLGTSFPELLCDASIKTGTNREPHSPGLLAPEVTKVESPTNSSAKHGITQVIYGTGNPWDIRPFAHKFGTL